jgi:hypothetical protein
MAATGTTGGSSMSVRTCPVTRRVFIDVFPCTPNKPPASKKLKTENHEYFTKIKLKNKNHPWVVIILTTDTSLCSYFSKNYDLPVGHGSQAKNLFIN